MAPHDRVTHAEALQSIYEQRCLRRCGPDPKAGPLAMPKSGPIEAEHTISLCQRIDESADQQILDHGTVSMEQHDPRRRCIAPLDIVQSYTIAFYELAKRRVSSLADQREHNVAND